MYRRGSHTSVQYVTGSSDAVAAGGRGRDDGDEDDQGTGEDDGAILNGREFR